MLSKSVEETSKIAQNFLKKILKIKKGQKGATVVALSGDLGAGKTAFTQAIAKHLGIKNKVASPTFVLIKKYPLKKSKNYTHLFHLDAYRLKNEKELMHIGWGEIINNKEHLVFIEWPEHVEKVIPARTKFVYITTNEKGHRKFKYK